MKTLEVTYTKNGYTFELVKREGLIAIYAQINEDTKDTIAYEVFKIQQMAAGFAGPQKYPQPAREVPPNSESWGRNGFTCHGLDKAEERFQLLLAR